MADEFERIMAFFNLSPQEKEERLQEVFEDSFAYFERFKHVLKTGTPEQKKEAIERVATLKKRIEEETKQICEKTGMSEEELAQFAKNPKNFSQPQWEVIEGAKKQLEKGVEGIEQTLNTSADGSLHLGQTEEKKGEAKKKRKKPKNWIPS